MLLNTLKTLFRENVVVLRNTSCVSVLRGSRYCNHWQMRMISLSVKKVDDLVDKIWDVRVTGLNSGQKVTIQATTEENKMKFGSFAQFNANSSGEVTLNSSESIAGTYTGADPMGLIWSMKPLPGQRSGLRLAKREILTPLSVKLNVCDEHRYEDELYNNEGLQPLVSQVIHRWYKSKDVTRSEIREGNVRGTLFTPPGDGPFQGVIDMFGTAGGSNESRAALLASYGFIVLSLPFFAYQDLPASLLDVDFSYFLEALDWFSSLSTVQCGGVGVVGASKGGEIALWMAVHSEKVTAAVNISGAPFMGVCPMKFGEKELPASMYDFSKTVKRDEGMAFLEALPYTVEALIPIHQSNSKVLILFGEDDQMNPVEHQYRYLDWLPEKKRKDVHLNVFPQAGHLIEPPYMPFCRASFHILFRDSLCWGGQGRQHNQAQVEAWKILLQFLAKNTGERTKRILSQL